MDDQLAARPSGRGRPHLFCSRGSEVLEVTNDAPALVHRRTASIEENQALDQAVATTVERLRTRGLEAQVVADRLNRRRIDLIPDSAWADPNKGGNLGARATPGGRRPVARMARRILERTGKPVVVVPAEAVAT